jgi:hypothetical protein
VCNSSSSKELEQKGKLKIPIFDMRKKAKNPGKPRENREFSPAVQIALKWL